MQPFLAVLITGIVCFSQFLQDTYGFYGQRYFLPRRYSGRTLDLSCHTQINEVVSFDWDRFRVWKSETSSYRLSLTLDDSVARKVVPYRMNISMSILKRLTRYKNLDLAVVVVWFEERRSVWFSDLRKIVFLWPSALKHFQVIFNRKSENLIINEIIEHKIKRNLTQASQ